MQHISNCYVISDRKVASSHVCCELVRGKSGSSDSSPPFTYQLQFPCHCNYSSLLLSLQSQTECNFRRRKNRLIKTCWRQHVYQIKGETQIMIYIYIFRGDHILFDSAHIEMISGLYNCNIACIPIKSIINICTNLIGLMI